MGDRSKTYIGAHAAAKFSADQERREIAESARRSEEQNRAHRSAQKCYAARTELLQMLNDAGNVPRDTASVKLTLAGAIGALTESGEVLDHIASAPNGGPERLRLELKKAHEEIATLKQTIAYLEEQAMPDAHLR